MKDYILSVCFHKYIYNKFNKYYVNALDHLLVYYGYGELQDCEMITIYAICKYLDVILNENIFLCIYYLTLSVSGTTTSYPMGLLVHNNYRHNLIKFCLEMLEVEEIRKLLLNISINELDFLKWKIALVEDTIKIQKSLKSK